MRTDTDYSCGLYLNRFELEVVHAMRRAEWPLTDEQADVLADANLMSAMHTGLSAMVMTLRREDVRSGFGRLLGVLRNGVVPIPDDAEATAALERLHDDFNDVLERVARLTRLGSPDLPALERGSHT
jgi:hypothetical protein